MLNLDYPNGAVEQFWALHYSVVVSISHDRNFWPRQMPGMVQ